MHYHLYLEEELDEAQLVGGDDHAAPVAHGSHRQLQLPLPVPLQTWLVSTKDNYIYSNSMLSKISMEHVYP